MKTQKCCVHCPGKLVPSGTNESHECCQPKYISGHLGIPSLAKHVSDYRKRKDAEKDLAKTPVEDHTVTSCYEHFALAKKLHAENLDHQPLPDKVDDSVFKTADPERS